jgi:molybdate transport system substrate-binding protein
MKAEVVMLKLISSMATRQVLAELAATWQQASGVEVVIESVGGVDAAKRVQAGEAFDGVVLASDAIDRLLAGGQLVAGSRVDLVRSSVALAVKAGAPRPDISTERLLRSAIEAAPTIGYSTGPSGVALVKLFERWGLSDSLQPKIVQAPPGVPVGTLVARGEVALGFQQLSELMHLEGITVVGPLPEPVSITTIFSAATCAVSTQGEILARLLAFMASSDAAAVKQRHGMEPAAGQ